MLFMHGRYCFRVTERRAGFGPMLLIPTTVFFFLIKKINKLSWENLFAATTALYNRGPVVRPRARIIITRGKI